MVEIPFRVDGPAFLLGIIRAFANKIEARKGL